jgi:hypothetical protein
MNAAVQGTASSVQNRLSSCFLPKNLNIKVYLLFYMDM